MTDIIRKGEKKHILTKQEIITLLADDNLTGELFAAADRMRKQYVGDKVHLRGLIEFSNICRQNCLYCGLRRDNQSIKRYRLKPTKIIELAAKASALGYRTVVLQSGEDDYYTVQRLQDIIGRIKAFDLAVTLSIGEKSEQEYAAYRAAGADRYLLRIETTDPELYSAMHPGVSQANRKRCLADLRRFGYEVGTGCLVGLPGQTIASLADDILFFQEINADMIGIGPFIPNPDTPLAAKCGGTLNLALKVMAIVRLLLPDINIPATTAMETLQPEGRLLALQVGANVVMPNVTEGEYRRLYALYPGKICVNDTPAHCRTCIAGKIAGIGRTIAVDQGFRRAVF